MAEQNQAAQLDEAISAINKRNKTMMLLVIGVALISLVGTGGTAAYLLLFKESAATAATENGDEHGEAKANAHEDTHFAAEPDESAPLGPTFAIDDMVINLDGEDSNRYLKISMVVEVNEDKTLEEVDSRRPQLQDIILTLVSSKNYADLQGADGKYRLREELRYRFNKVFKGRIGRLYFTSFVVQ